MVHPEHRVFHTMPHPPPHIWAHLHNWILQPLYLSTITTTTSFITKIKSNVLCPYFPHLGEAHPQDSGSEVIQLLLINMHLDRVPAGDCGLQWWHVFHW